MKWYFEMSEAGLLSIEIHHHYLVTGNADDREVVDNAAFVGIEDSRPVLMEVQVLTTE
uniref:DNA repair protein RadA, putative n=1 Tax=Brugia malayi TaxID=6279 RepID=A8NPZ7_BRUMA